MAEQRPSRLIGASSSTRRGRGAVEELTGYTPEGVSGLQWDGETWLVTVDVCELARDPEHDRRDGHLRRPARRRRRPAAATSASAASSAAQAEERLSDGPAACPAARRPSRAARSTANLADILERVLDKGIVIAGDIQINLLDIELLTIKLRLLVASVDKAREMGIDWWESDPSLQNGGDGNGDDAQAARAGEPGAARAARPARARLAGGRPMS